MSMELATVRLILSYQDVWFAHFPSLSRRAEWHVVSHLCVKGRDGSPAGELYGLVKQVFLMDDATVKERLLAMSQAGLCAFDPPGTMSSRTVVLPTTELLAKFDAHLLDFAGKLVVLPSGDHYAVADTLAPLHRSQILQALDTYMGHWSQAIDAIFDLGRLSPARRSDAKRHLLSPSHWNLLHQTVLWQLEDEAGAKGILADRLAARLLELTGQSFQTTRDHIAYLIEIQLFRRMKGKALHVTLTEAALRRIGDALSATAHELPAILGGAAPDGDEQTIKHRPTSAERPKNRAVLDIVRPPDERRRIEIESSLLLGRAPPSDVVLSGQDISRSHCRIDFDGHRLTVTDLDSTNGTLVNGAPIATETVLVAGDKVEIGRYCLVYQGDTIALQDRPFGSDSAGPIGGEH